MWSAWRERADNVLLWFSEWTMSGGWGKQADVKILQDICLGSGSAYLDDNVAEVELRNVWDAAVGFGEVRVQSVTWAGEGERRLQHSLVWCGEKLPSCYSWRALFAKL